MVTPTGASGVTEVVTSAMDSSTMNVVPGPTNAPGTTSGVTLDATNPDATPGATTPVATTPAATTPAPTTPVATTLAVSEQQRAAFLAAIEADAQKEAICEELVRV